MQYIRPNLISPSCGKLRFRPVLNLPSYNIDYTFYIRKFIRPCFEHAHRQLGELGETKTRANKTRSTVFFCLVTQIQCYFSMKTLHSVLMVETICTQQQPQQ